MSSYGTSWGGNIPVSGIGKVKLKCLRNEVLEVFYVPQLESNLLSLINLATSGFEICFDGDACEIRKREEFYATGHLQDSLHVIEPQEGNLKKDEVASQAMQNPQLLIVLLIINVFIYIPQKISSSQF